MANSMFSSSAKPHFLKPILPGFKTYILIPKAFYSKYLEGRQEGNAAELRSDVSEITWNIKIDGRRITKGWEEFAVGHNLQVGDILVFRHERNLLFHVTPFGLSCCEILYSQNDEKDVKDKTGKVTRYRTVKETAKNECSSVETDFVYLPRGFTTSSGLSKLCNEIILMDEKGRPSTLKLCCHKSSNRFCVSRGWRAFCCRNGFKTGCFLRPILVRKGKTPVLRIFPLERDENSIRNHSKKIKQEVEHDTVKEETNVESGKLIRDRFVKKDAKNLCSSSHDTNFVVPVTPSNQRHDAFHLPKGFTTSSGLSKLCKKIIFVDEKGRSSILDLSYDKSDNRFTVRRGWRAFCCRNGHKTGCFLRLIVVRNEKTPVLRIFPLEKDESSIGKNSKKIKQEVEHESAEEEKNMESLSLSNNSSFVVSVTVSNLREDILYLPIRLSRSNILDKKFHQISLMNKQGRTWTLSLKYSKSSGKFRISHGWKSFCEANGQNAGCTFLFKLVRNRTAPVLLMASLGDDIYQSKTGL
ncbi:B3 DNA binding domain [Arabidopsis thaliana x Arabidopsis arenosa]|uniref:B3 DNA binding domain n=1 Tax=Arabidopsis thaliana x Arabidopsis arenosa TaxID=1240361 RepID=A0A8T1YCJ8_9BRAS|nr:B3 DNA binding domain [Arabidopsis thaliana x Arabidopsis arenosa]